MPLRKFSLRFLRPVTTGVIFATLFCVFGSTKASAEGCTLLTTIQLTAYQQDLVDVVISPTQTRSTFKQIKITTQDVLNRLATHYATTFPPGSKLCFHRGTGDTTMNVYDKANNHLLTVDEAVIDLVRQEPTFHPEIVPGEFILKCADLPLPPPGCVDIPQMVLVPSQTNLLAITRTRDATTSFLTGQYWTLGALQLHFGSAPAIDTEPGGQMVAQFSWKAPSLILKTTENIDVAGPGTLDSKPTIFTGKIRLLGSILLIGATS